MTLPIHVFPPLRARIVRRGCRWLARVSGGDGVVLSERWSRRGRAVRVTVADAAGGMASAALRARAPVCKAAAP